MITIKFEEQEFYNEETTEFVQSSPRTVDFEYSLSAVAKWEAKWKKPFLNSEINVDDPCTIDFFIKMSKDPTLMEEELTEDVKNSLINYINDPQTATTFNTHSIASTNASSKAYSSEEIYAIMFLNGVPIELENINLNRLLVILKIISIYNDPDRKKMSKNEVLSQNRKLNEERKKQYNTRG